MGTRLCERFGLISGGAVGFLVQMIGVDSCCGNPPPALTVAQCSLAGLIVALIVLFFATLFACVVSKLPILPLAELALIIGIVVGVLLGPIAYHLPVPGSALFICAILGALLGWITCRILCRDAKWTVLP